MGKNLILYVLIEALLIVGCGQDSCLEGGEAVIGDLNASSVYYSGYSEIKLANDQDTIPSADHVVWLEVDPEFVSVATSGIPGRAYADCKNKPFLKQQIKQIQVFALTDYTEDLTVGMDLTEYFVFLTPGGSETFENTSILNLYFQTDFYLFLKPTIGVDITRQVQLRLLVTLDNDLVMQVDTSPVYVSLSL